MSKVAKWIFPAAGGKDGIIGTAKAVFGFATGNWGMVASGVAQVAGLGKKKQAAQDRQANVTSLTIGEVPREAVLGQTCTGGSLIDVFSFGGKYGTDTVTYCVALADHAIDGIVGYFVNDRYYPWVGEGLQAAFSNKLSFHFRQATVDGHEPPLHVRNAGAGWTVNDRLAGIAHIWIDTHLDDKVWSQGWPKFKFVLRGLRVFDPRFDPALGYSGPNPQTWENRASHKFSTNAVLLRYAVARGIYAEGHQGEEEHLLIGRGLSAEEAPPSRIIAAANLCDESVNGKPRYSASGVISAAEDFATVEEMFATAMAGLIVQREGGVEVEPGQAKAAVVTITDADLVTGEPVTFSHFLPDGSDGRINTVAPRYIEPAQGYKDHAGPVRRSIPDIQKDRGPREMTLVQPLVTDVDQSDRNAEIARLRSRCERRSQIVLPPAFAALEEGDWIAWKSDRYHEGATVRYLVESFALNEKWRNSLVLSEIAASVFGGTDPVEVVPVPPPPPPVIDALSLSGVVIEAITLAGDTSTLPAIRFRWDVTVTDTAIIAVRAEVRRVGETEAAPTRFEDVAKGEMIVTNGVGPDLALEARLVPIGDPSRPVVPTTWTTVSTTPLVAGDTTNVGGRPVGQVVQSLDEVLLDVQALEIEATAIARRASDLEATATPRSFAQDGAFFTDDFAREQASPPDPVKGEFATIAGTRVWRNAGAPHGGLATKGKIALRGGGSIRFTARYRVIQDSANGSPARPIYGLTLYDAAGVKLTDWWIGTSFTPLTAAEGWKTADYTLTTELARSLPGAANAAYAKPVIIPTWGDPPTTAVGEVAYLYAEDAALIARVADNEAALIAADGKLQAWSQKRVIAGQAQAFAQMMALDENGVPTSSVRFGAGEIGLWNQIGGEDLWVEVLTLQGGNGRFSGNLSVASGIYLGNGTVWSVALRPQTFVRGDGETISFGGANIGVPTYEFMRDNLLPLAAGESYDLQIKNLTAAGGTVWAKISIPGTPSAQTLAGPGTAPGSGPTRQNIKTPKPDSVNGNYTITLSGTYAFTIFKNTQFQDYEGSVTVGLFVRKAGVWSRVGALTASWYTNTDNPSSVNRVEIVPWTVTDTVQMGDSIEAFGATIESSSGPFAGRSVGLLSLGPIDWSSQGSASGTKSALASGAKTSIKITPQG